MKVGVFVLGELGCSPRMQYHSYSLSQLPQVTEVHAIGLAGAKVHPLLQEQNKVFLHLLSSQWWNWIPKRPTHGGNKLLTLLWFLICAPLKILLQMFCLALYCLLYFPYDTDYVIVQNPPAIPTLLLIPFILKFAKKNCKLILDWHNFGYTLLQMEKTDKRSVIIRFAYWIEFTFGKLFTYKHLCVSQAMKQVLQKEHQIDATVFYDRPPKQFQILSLDDKHTLFIKLFGTTEKDSTIFTYKKDDQVFWRKDRPILMVSSTSWTPDENFHILLDAMQQIDSKTQHKIKLMITGKGPLKEYYLNKINNEMTWKNVQIETVWLAAEDYPKLLACCDLGICLHVSSSGVDLPMKVVDMFGTGLPVCAIEFEAIGELVKHDENGYIFKNATQLSEQILDLFKSFPEDVSKLDQMRQHITKYFQPHRWNEEWSAKVKPLLN